MGLSVRCATVHGDCACACGEERVSLTSVSRNWVFQRSTPPLNCLTWARSCTVHMTTRTHSQPTTAHHVVTADMAQSLASNMAISNMAVHNMAIHILAGTCSASLSLTIKAHKAVSSGLHCCALGPVHMV